MAAPIGPPNPLQARVEARRALHAPTPVRPALPHSEGDTALACAVFAAIVAFIGVLTAIAALVS